MNLYVPTYLLIQKLFGFLLNFETFYPDLGRIFYAKGSKGSGSGDLEQRLSKSLLSWWKEFVPGERESDSATLAES